MLWKILLAIGLFIVAIIGVGFYYVHRIEERFERDNAAQLKLLDPKIVINDAKFTKRVFSKSPSIGRVTQIIGGGLENESQGGLTVISNFGIHYLSADGELKRTTSFSNPARSYVELISLDHAGDYGFLTRDQSWAEDVVLFDRSGRQMWSYSNRPPGIDDASPAEAGENGKSTFVVGLNGRGGIVLLDSQGKQIWRKPEGNVWHVESLDVDGDGRREILQSNAQGQLLVRNMNGDVTNRYAAGYYVAHFSLTRWGNEASARHILIPTTGFNADCGKKLLLVLDAQGKTVATLDAIAGEWAAKSAGVPMRTTTDRLFAVIQSGVLPRSVLSIYNAENRIVYREVLGETCPALNAVTVDSQDRLFVGCNSSVLEYTPTARQQD
jgi:hypothetical protein